MSGQLERHPEASRPRVFVPFSVPDWRPCERVASAWWGPLRFIELRDGSEAGERLVGEDGSEADLHLPGTAEEGPAPVGPDTVNELAGLRTEHGAAARQVGR
jgi:hypothetical protein